MVINKLLAVLLCIKATAMYGMDQASYPPAPLGQTGHYDGSGIMARNALQIAGEIQYLLPNLSKNRFNSSAVDSQWREVFNSAVALSKAIRVMQPEAPWSPLPTPILLSAAIKRTMRIIEANLQSPLVIESQTEIAIEIAKILHDILSNPAYDTAKNRASACEVLLDNAFTDMHEQLTIIMGKAEYAHMRPEARNAPAAKAAVHSFLSRHYGSDRSQLETFMHHEYRTRGYSF